MAGVPQFVASISTSCLETRFLGSGWFATSRHVVTCRHVVKDFRHAVADLVVELDTRTRRFRVAKLCESPDVDLALLVVDADYACDTPAIVESYTTNAMPLLCSASLRACGYVQRGPNPSPMSYDLCGSLHKPGYNTKTGVVTDIQVEQSLLDGMSGSPVLLSHEDAFACVGTVYLGGERAAKSRLIPSSYLVPFFRAHGIQCCAQPLASSVGDRPTMDVNCVVDHEGEATSLEMTGSAVTDITLNQLDAVLASYFIQHETEPKPSLATYGELRTLRIYDSRIGEGALKMIGQLGGLMVLQLSNNPGINDQCLTHLVGLRLRTLDLTGCGLTEDGRQWARKHFSNVNNLGV